MKKYIITEFQGGGATKKHTSQRFVGNLTAKNLSLWRTAIFNFLERFEKHPAFTLAEVLITLGIIGIVAAMTLPAIIGNSKKVEASSRLKKFSSSMSQALLMAQIENGDMNDWEYGGKTVTDEDGNHDYEANGKITKDFFMRYLAKYFNYTTILDGKNAILDDDGEIQTPANNTTIYFEDSSQLIIFNGNCMDLIFDVNGDNRPNLSGRDRFRFLFCPLKNYRARNCGNTAFCSYMAQLYKTRESALAACKVNAVTCARLLEIDNWEFKKDYPYKL